VFGIAKDDITVACVAAHERRVMHFSDETLKSPQPDL
jgi:hypothetical protein